MYVIGLTLYWTNGNDLMSEGVWIWPVEGGGDFSGADPTVYNNWEAGNISIISEFYCVYFDMFVLIECAVPSKALILLLCVRCLLLLPIYICVVCRILVH